MNSGSPNQAVMKKTKAIFTPKLVKVQSLISLKLDVGV